MLTVCPGEWYMYYYIILHFPVFSISLTLLAAAKTLQPYKMQIK